MELFGQCPYCGETISILADTGGAATQSYVEDCEVCCRPISVTLRLDSGGGASLELSRLDD